MPQRSPSAHRQGAVEFGASRPDDATIRREPCIGPSLQVRAAAPRTLAKRKPCAGAPQFPWRSTYLRPWASSAARQCSRNDRRSSGEPMKRWESSTQCQ